MNDLLAVNPGQIPRGSVVLLTGGFGFIGSHLVQALARHDGVKSICIVDNNEGWPSSRLVGASDAGFSALIADVNDARTWQRLDDKPTHIIHLAASSHVEHSISRPIDVANTNFMGTVHALEFARSVGAKFIFASTSEIYGSNETESIRLYSELVPHSPYAAAKAGADLMVQAYTRTYGLDVRVARMFNVFGAGQYYEKVVPMMICCALSGRPFPIQGDGSSVRDWTHVSDMCTKLLHLAFGNAEPVTNLASGCALSVAEIAAMVAELSSLPHPGVLRLPARRGNVQRQTSAETLAAPRATSSQVEHFKSGLRATIAWYGLHMPKWIDGFLVDHGRLVKVMAVNSR